MRHRTQTRFEFDFDRRFEPVLALLGATRRNSGVELRDDRLFARLGPWSVSTGIDNIVGLAVTGPYHWYRAIGVRLSLSDRGLTFGTNARLGLCLKLDRPVRSFMGINHPALTVTVLDPEALKSAIEADRLAS